MKLSGLAAMVCCLTAAVGTADERWIEFTGKSGPGVGKHIVLISGDDEYRSEEALPQLAKILSMHHGFKTTVLFSLDPDGTINPEQHHNIPGLEHLKTADLAILGLRFRDLPDEQMAYFVDYIESGKPVIGLRTSTHAFDIKDKSKKYYKYAWTSDVKGYEQGFGRQVLGESWVSHHGNHGQQSTRGMFVKGQEKHPILTGIKDGEIWGPTDVYGVRLPLPGDSQPLLLGQVVEGMQSTDPAATGPKNEPMLPVAWTKTYQGSSGKTSRVFCTTMGAATDLKNEPLRRLLVNASFWAMGMENKIPEQADVALVGDYQPTKFSFGGYRKGLKPADYAK
ncbi:MAG: ThuA domain-containing protein [Planctomycetaceae bacterium]